MDFQEHVLTLINSPACVTAEGIATTARKTVFEDDELEEWYREEMLPRAALPKADATKIMEVDRALKKMDGIWGNAAFMLYDQKKSTSEISSYVETYGLST